MQILVNEDADKDYNVVEYYLFYKHESSPHWFFIHRYDHLDSAKKGIENHKVKYINKYGGRKISYRIMELAKDIKFIYE